MSTPNFTSQNDQRNKANTLGDFENKKLTHISIFKTSRQIPKSNPQGIGSNFLYPRISLATATAVFYSLQHACGSNDELYISRYGLSDKRNSR